MRNLCKVAALPFQAHANYGTLSMKETSDGWSIYNILTVNPTPVCLKASMTHTPVCKGERKKMYLFVHIVCYSIV